MAAMAEMKKRIQNQNKYIKGIISWKSPDFAKLYGIDASNVGGRNYEATSRAAEAQRDCLSAQSMTYCQKGKKGKRARNGASWSSCAKKCAKRTRVPGFKCHLYSK